MKNQNNLEEKIEKKLSRRDKKKNRQMKVSGKGVFQLKRIIASKNRKNEK